MNRAIKRIARHGSLPYTICEVKTKQTIGVLAGGDSTEREISLSSGKRVFAALLDLNYDPHFLEIGSLDDIVRSVRRMKLAFNCLHGGSGENGIVQALLDVLQISYPGSRALASALAMNKVDAKKIFRSHRINVPDDLLYEAGSIESFCSRAAKKLSFPIVVKPTNHGSSIGIGFAETHSDLGSLLSNTISQFGSVLVEEYISGRELTVGILLIDGEEIALPPIETRLSNNVFDYRSKYEPGAVDVIVPAPLKEQTLDNVKNTALDAHTSLGCSGFSRVDMRLGEGNTPYVLEVNTLPGMTLTSDLPRAAAAIGFEFPQLIELMIQTASKEVVQ